MVRPTNHHSIHIKKAEFLLLVLASCVIISIIYKSPIQVDGYYTYLDPLKSLLVSQAIIEYGTIKLDHYAQSGVANPQDLRIETYNDHLYYYFPVGTSLFATPFVWLANLSGRRMTSAAYEAWLQCVLSSLTVAGFLMLSYLVGRYFLRHGQAFLVAVMFTLGTSVMSTMGAALWSINFEILFILCGLLFLAKKEWSASQYEAYLSGIALFAAYLCRPTAITFIAPASIYVAFKKRAGLVPFGLTGMLLFGLFMMFAWHEYHQLLPPYYLPQRLQQTTTFWTAFYGNLVSPARGVFVYNPQMIVIVLTGFVFFRTIWKSSLIRLSLAWFVLHLIVVSRFPHWWGGGSFGPRLMTDTIPAFLLLTVVMLRMLMQETSWKKLRLLFGVLVLLALAGGYINTYQGLFNVCTSRWNNFPTIDRYPEYLFSWQYPQFLSTPELLRKKMSDYRSHYPDRWTEADLAIFHESDCSKVY